LHRDARPRSPLIGEIAMKAFTRLLTLAAILATLAGCASDPRYSQGLQWVVDQQKERSRLQSQGFPQYSNF
jgi:hypothetical protein